MAKQALNAPSSPIQLQGFVALEAVAHNKEVRSSPVGFHRLAGKEKFQPEDILQSHRSFSPSANDVFSQMFANNDILFDADNVAHFLLIEPGEPGEPGESLFSDKLTVHSESLDILCMDKFQQSLG